MQRNSRRLGFVSAPNESNVSNTSHYIPSVSNNGILDKISRALELDNLKENIRRKISNARLPTVTLDLNRVRDRLSRSCPSIRISLPKPSCPTIDMRSINHLGIDIKEKMGDIKDSIVRGGSRAKDNIVFAARNMGDMASTLGSCIKDQGAAMNERLADFSRMVPSTDNLSTALFTLPSTGHFLPAPLPPISSILPRLAIAAESLRTRTAGRRGGPEDQNEKLRLMLMRVKALRSLQKKLKLNQQIKNAKFVVRPSMTLAASSSSETNNNNKKSSSFLLSSNSDSDDRFIGTATVSGKPSVQYYSQDSIENLRIRVSIRKINPHQKKQTDSRSEEEEDRHRQEKGNYDDEDVEKDEEEFEEEEEEEEEEAEEIEEEEAEGEEIEQVEQENSEETEKKKKKKSKKKKKKSTKKKKKKRASDLDDNDQARPEAKKEEDEDDEKTLEFQENIGIFQWQKKVFSPQEIVDYHKMEASAVSSPLDKIFKEDVDRIVEAVAKDPRRKHQQDEEADSETIANPGALAASRLVTPSRATVTASRISSIHHHPATAGAAELMPEIFMQRARKKKKNNRNTLEAEEDEDREDPLEMAIEGARGQEIYGISRLLRHRLFTRVDNERFATLAREDLLNGEDIVAVESMASLNQDLLSKDKKSKSNRSSSTNPNSSSSSSSENSASEIWKKISSFFSSSKNANPATTLRKKSGPINKKATSNSYAERTKVMYIMASFGKPNIVLEGPDRKENVEWNGEERILCIIRSLPDGGIVMKPGLTLLPEEEQAMKQEEMKKRRAASVGLVDQQQQLLRESSIKRETPYTFRLENGDVYEYTLRLFNDKPKDSEIDKVRQKLVKQLRQKAEVLKRNLVGFSFAASPPSPLQARFHWMGEIVSACNFDTCEALFVRYHLEMGGEGEEDEARGGFRPSLESSTKILGSSSTKGMWNLWSSDDSIRQRLTSTTSVASVSLLDPSTSSPSSPSSIAIFNFPFEFHAQYNGGANSPLSQTPRVLLEVFSIDGWNRRRIEGYGFFNMPSLPGFSEIEVETWRPKPSVRQRLQSFFVGGSAEIEDVSFATSPASARFLSKYGFVSESAGSVKVRFSCVLHKRIEDLSADRALAAKSQLYRISDVSLEDAPDEVLVASKASLRMSENLDTSATDLIEPRQAATTVIDEEDEDEDREFRSSMRRRNRKDRSPLASISRNDFEEEEEKVEENINSNNNNELMLSATPASTRRRNRK